MNAIERFVAMFEPEGNRVAFRIMLEELIQEIKNKAHPANETLKMRDYFAGQAMQSIITDGKLGLHLTHSDYMKFVSETSYEYADAMMEARK